VNGQQFIGDWATVTGWDPLKTEVPETDKARQGQKKSFENGSFRPKEAQKSALGVGRTIGKDLGGKGGGMVPVGRKS